MEPNERHEEDLNEENDPFYSEANMRYLERIIRDVKEGRAHFAEHELIDPDE